MSTLVLPQPRRRRAVSLSAITALAQRPELLFLLAVAGVLNLWALDLNGYANDYYAAAVRSMTQSWHAFLYGSFDAAGLQTVDKPPLALWVQALSARAFGFNSWALLVPQALMGVATVGLVYDMTVKRFGRQAAFVAGMALALTPITVAISRHNNPDALLVLCLVAAVWATDRGLRAGGNTRWLLAAGAFVGPRVRDEDGRGAAGRPGDRRGVVLGRAEGPRRRGQAAARRWRRDGGRRARVADADVADAGVARPYIVGHR